MNIATIITITLILYAAIVTIALAVVVERVGFWKQEAQRIEPLERANATLRKWIARLERDAERKQAAINRHVASAYALEGQNMLLEDENASLRAWKRQQEGVLARAVMGSVYVRPADSMLVRSEIAP